MIPISTWSEGYITDINYTTNFYFHQSPDFLNFCCLLYGYEPFDLNTTFNYCELGCGNGFTIILLASLYPHANFYAIDFNPDHIVFANSLKKYFNLDNIKFFNISFKETVDEKLEEFPEFNMITLHGVFSWVSHENRNRIIEFTRKKLKAGGILNVSYNNMCGWFMRIPFQRLIIDFAKLFPEIISAKKVEIVINLIRKMQQAGSEYFNSPAIKKTLGKMDEMSINYIVHEYLNEDWQPLFFSEVCSYMHNAKLKYLGMADPIWYFNDLLFNDNQLKVLNEFRSMYMREIAKDYILRLAFRKDIYIKGGVMLPRDIYYKKMFNKVKFVLNKPIEDDKMYKIDLDYTKRRANINRGILNKLFEELTLPKTIEELMECSILNSIKDKELLRIISMLIHKNIVTPIISNVDINDNKKNSKIGKIINRFIAKDARYRNELKHFLIPKFKTAMNVNIIKRLVYDAIINEEKDDINDILLHVKLFLKNRSINWKAFDENKSKDEILNKEISECIEKFFPFWEKVGAL